MILKSIKYSLKIWLSSVAIAPVLFLSIEALISKTPNAFSNQFGMYPIIAFYQAIFSFITFVIFTVIIILITNLYKGKVSVKWPVCIAGILLTVGTFAIVFFPDGVIGDYEFFYLMLCNCACIGGGVWFYRLTVTGD